MTTEPSELERKLEMVGLAVALGLAVMAWLAEWQWLDYASQPALPDDADESDASYDV